MQTAGDLLKTARLKKKLTFTQISKLTKIPKKALEALEKNQFDKLPPRTYIIGFIKNYAKVLNLDDQKTIAVFRRDYNRQKKKKLVPQGFTKPLSPSWQPNSKTRTFLSLAFVVLFLTLYLGISFFKLTKPPKLVIYEPENTNSLTSPVLIKGQTNRDATLTLNGKTINLEPDGRFTTIYNGDPGAHKLKFISTSRRQNSTQITHHIILTE